MGRMLEALKQSSVARPPALKPVEVSPLKPEDVPEAETEQDIPFIEVGRRRGEVEASPSVLAVAPKKNVAPPGPVRLDRAVWKVAFRPVPAKPAILASPEQRFAPELIAYHQPDHPVSAQYRALAEQLPRARPQVLLFTATAAGAGTTTVLLNVALSYARLGEPRVAVVDANFRQPAVAERLGLPAAPGLSEVLIGSLPLADALQESGAPGLTVLTAGAGSRMGSAAHHTLSAVWQQLRERFEIVLVDAPCWDSGPDIRALGSECDAVFLVLREDEVKSPAVKDVIETMREQDVCLLGCISTRA